MTSTTTRRPRAALFDLADAATSAGENSFTYGPPWARTLVDILASTAEAHPDAVAIDNGAEVLTYTELMAEVVDADVEADAGGFDGGQPDPGAEGVPGDRRAFARREQHVMGDLSVVR